MAVSKKNKDDSKIPVSKLVDVAKPGETAASATSRPIIVGHGSTMKLDPMVKAAAGDAKDTPPPASVKTRGYTVIDPPKHNDSVDKIQVSSPTNDTSNQATKPEPSNPQSSDSAAVDALAGGVSTKKEEQKADEEAAKRALELENMIASKEYFVPIGEAKRRRSNQNLLAVIILLLFTTLAGLNFAVDADMLDIGIPPLTNLL